MTRDDIIRMAREAGWNGIYSKPLMKIAMQEEDFLRFAALVAAAEREKIAQSWDALHDKYMADPLRRHMPLSYELVANLIRGRA